MQLKGVQLCYFIGIN